MDHATINKLLFENERLRGELAESRALHEATKETVRLSVERIAELEAELEEEKRFCLAIKADYDAWLKMRDELVKDRIAVLEAELEEANKGK